MTEDAKVNSIGDDDNNETVKKSLFLKSQTYLQDILLSYIPTLIAYFSKKDKVI